MSSTIWYVILGLTVLATAYLMWPRSFEGPLTDGERATLSASSRLSRLLPFLAPGLAIVGFWFALPPTAKLSVHSLARSEPSPETLAIEWSWRHVREIHVECIAGHAVNILESGESWRNEDESSPRQAAVKTAWDDFLSGKIQGCPQPRFRSRAEVESVELTLVDLASRTYNLTEVCLDVPARRTSSDPWESLRAVLSARGAEDTCGEATSRDFEVGEIQVLANAVLAGREKLRFDAVVKADPCATPMVSPDEQLTLHRHDEDGSTELSCDHIEPADQPESCETGQGARAVLRSFEAHCPELEAKKGAHFSVASRTAPEVLISNRSQRAKLVAVPDSETAWASLRATARASSGGMEKELERTGLAQAAKSANESQVSIEIGADSTTVWSGARRTACAGQEVPANSRTLVTSPFTQRPQGNGTTPPVRCIAGEENSAPVRCIHIAFGSRTTLPDQDTYNVEDAVYLYWATEWAAATIVTDGSCTASDLGDVPGPEAPKLLLSTVAADEALGAYRFHRTAPALLFLSLSVLAFGLGLWRSLGGTHE